MNPHNTSKLGRVLISVAAAATIVVPPIADANESHLGNHAWPPHARYHGALLLALSTLLGLTSLWLLWRRADAPNQRFRGSLAAWLAAMFWISFFPALLVPGTSTWIDGVTHGTLPAPNVAVALLLVVLCALGAWFLRNSTPVDDLSSTGGGRSSSTAS